MSVEELLKPRYKVIADWPGNDYYTVGQVIELHFNTPGNSVVKGQIEGYNKYPHLFKKLEWWEERAESDMPRYIKKGNRVYDVSKANEKHNHCLVYDFPTTEHWVFYKECVPITESEYLSQNQIK